jgi:hypothetical protein
MTFDMTKHSITTIVMMIQVRSTFSIMTFDKVTFSIMTFDKMTSRDRDTQHKNKNSTLSIMTLSITH